MGIHCNHQEILETAIFQALEESIPSRLRFVIEHAEAENFMVSVLVCPIGDQSGFTSGIILEDKSLERDIAMPGHRSCDPPYPGLKFTLPCAVAAVCTLL